MKILSKNSIHTIDAYDRGYRVIDGCVISPFSGKLLKLRNYGGYYRFSISSREKYIHSYHIHVHKLVAYQKFGIKAFECEAIRHLNENSLDNLPDNIELGTHTQNIMDRSKKARVTHAKIAASYLRKFTDEEIKEVVRLHMCCRWTYVQIAAKYHVVKSTISYIINGKTYV